MVSACGSTAPLPSAPTPVPAYPSLLGVYPGSGRLVLEFRDTGGSNTYGCTARLNVLEQTGDTFSGLADLDGGSGDSGRHCTWRSKFIAQMAVDGTITSFRADPSFGGYCAQFTSKQTFTGTATSTVIFITITDHGTCFDGRGQLRDTDRTLTITARRL